MSASFLSSTSPSSSSASSLSSSFVPSSCLSPVGVASSVVDPTPAEQRYESDLILQKADTNVHTKTFVDSAGDSNGTTNTLPSGGMIVRQRSLSGSFASGSLANSAAAAAVGPTHTAIALPAAAAFATPSTPSSLPMRNGAISSGSAGLAVGLRSLALGDLPEEGSISVSAPNSTTAAAAAAAMTANSNSAGIWATPGRTGGGRSFSVALAGSASISKPDLSSASHSHSTSLSSTIGSVHGRSMSLSSSPFRSSSSDSGLSNSPSPSPAPHTSASASGAASLMSKTSAYVRAKIRATIRSSVRDARSQDDAKREWSNLIARWNEFQLSGLGGLQLPSKELRTNQAKLTDLLASQGIPTPLRATVWMMMIGNGLGLTLAEFERLKATCAVERMEFEQWKRRINPDTQQTPGTDEGDGDTSSVSSISSSPSPSSPSSSSSISPSHIACSLIDQDLPRTFPTLQFFHAGGPYEQPLRVVLECTAKYRKMKVIQQQAVASSSSSCVDSAVIGTGYVQGMSFLACILFLALGDDEFLIFLTLCNLLDNPQEHLSELFHMDESSCTRWMMVFDTAMRQATPHLYSHFRSIGISADMFLWKWIFSLYSQALELDTVFRIWDGFLWECFKRRGQAEVNEQTGGVIATNANTHTTVNHGGTPTITRPTSASARASSAIREAISSAREAISNATSSSSSSSSSSAPLVAAQGTGFPYLFRVGLGLLSMYSDSLLTCSFEESLYFLQHLPGSTIGNNGNATPDDTLDVDLLMQHVKEVKIDLNMWQRATTTLNQTTTKKHTTTVTHPSTTPMTPTTTSRPDYSGQGSPANRK